MRGVHRTCSIGAGPHPLLLAAPRSTGLRLRPLGVVALLLCGAACLSQDLAPLLADLRGSPTPAASECLAPASWPRTTLQRSSHGLGIQPRKHVWRLQQQPCTQALASHCSWRACAQHCLAIGPMALLVHPCRGKPPIAVIAGEAAIARLGHVWLLVLQHASVAKRLWRKAPWPRGGRWVCRRRRRRRRPPQRLQKPWRGCQSLRPNPCVMLWTRHRLCFPGISGG
mmetsp:Transcript_113909/g.317190  ORF Transcript_113909/g.317190 Transcript_113909/m.317190 type:complete len:226 (-) Transcript_113909:483-1160(-)